MPSTYPGAVDSITNPTPTNPMNSPSHAGEHDSANNAVEAVQTVVGITGAFNFLQTAGGTMSGPIAMGANKITGVANGSSAQDAAAYGQLSLFAPLASPALTGTPTAPTASGGTNTTQLATTAFVTAAIPTALPPNGSAGGDLTGSYPNPTLSGTTNVESIISANSTVAAAQTAAQVATAVGAETSRAETAEALLAPLASPALTGSPTAPTQAASDNSTKIATDAFVTTAVANAVAGVNPAVAVLAATVAAGDTSALTYANGVGGVGATFTGTINTTVTIDGVLLNTLGQRVLVKNDTQSANPGAYNGIYFVTVISTAGTAPVFTRALDYDTPSDMNNTGAIPAQSGTVNTTTSWLLTSQIVTVGTTALTFAQFSLNPSTLAPLASPALTGTPTAPTASGATNTTQLATTAFVQTATALDLPLAGGTMSGAIAMGSNKITGLTNGSGAQDAAAFGQLPTLSSLGANPETVTTATVTTTATLALGGNVLTLTSGSNLTLTMPAAAAGAFCWVKIIQPASGTTTNTVTQATSKWPGGTKPTMSTGANATDRYDYYSDGASWFGLITGQAFA